MYTAFPFQTIFQDDQIIGGKKFIHIKECQLINAEIMMELEIFLFATPR